VLGKFSDDRLHLGQQDILFEGVLGGYGLCWPVRDYFAVVDSPSQLVETHAIAAETSAPGLPPRQRLASVASACAGKPMRRTAGPQARR
jgi:hypothetical protein